MGFLVPQAMRGKAGREATQKLVQLPGQPLPLMRGLTWHLKVLAIRDVTFHSQQELILCKKSNL